MKILIVDDDDLLRLAIRHAVTVETDVVIECNNGLDAIRLFDEHMPDWVLMDIMMEPMDGLAATSKIKERHPDARVIILTSFNQKEFAEAARKAGAVQFIPKDNLSELRSQMRY